MRDRRGAVARATGLAEGVAAAVRRRQQARLPRIVLQDPSGEPRLLSPDSPVHPELLATAEALVELALEEAPAGEEPPDPDEQEPQGPPSRRARSSAARRSPRP